MRTIAWCLLTLSLVGCQSGPRWFSRDYDTRGRSSYDERFAPEAEPQPAQPSHEGPNLTVPPQPAQRDRTPYESSSSRSHGWFGSRSTSQASRSKSSNRTTQTARRSTTPAPAVKSGAQDESVKQLLADLEKVKREKATLETKLTEESAKQTQQRLELEARLALIQEQVRQQSALQQVMYQQQATTMSRPMPNYSVPVITSGTPSPAMQIPFSSSAPISVPQQPQQWGQSTPTWNTPSAPQQQQVEQWPFSPQRR